MEKREAGRGQVVGMLWERGSGTEIERETETHTDGRWNIASMALYFQT